MRIRKSPKNRENLHENIHLEMKPESRFKFAVNFFSTHLDIETIM